MAIFLEALSEVAASCNFGVVVVAVAVSLAALGSVRVVAATVASAIVGGWLFAADVSLPLGRAGGTVVHVVVLAALVIGVLFARRRIWLAAGIAAGAEFLATLWWRPCVGRELAGVINRGLDWSTAGGMALYMLGLMIPAIGLSAGVHVVVESLGRRGQLGVASEVSEQ